ncbi:MAG TPA: hypothetical protein VMW64_01780 [Dehalococcoidia bacterium]|nr:hypothetical protein [Dehalococcoidia bacterium]
MDKPTKIMERLAIDTLAVFRTQVISVSEGGLAGETPRNIVVDIEGNIEEGLNVNVGRVCVSDLFYGYFEVKLGEN